MPRKKTVSIRTDRRRLDPETGAPYRTLRWTDPTTGQRSSKALGYLSDLEAEDAAEDQRARLRLNLASASTDVSGIVTVDELVERFIAEGLHGGHEHIRASLSRLGHLGRLLGETRVDQMSTAVLRRYQAQRKREVTRLGAPTASYSVHTEVSQLRTAWRWARQVGLVTQEPPPSPSRATLENDARPPRCLTEGELRQILELARELWGEDAAMPRLLQFTAWCPRRPKAIGELRREDCARVLDPALPRASQLVYWRADKGGEGRGWGPIPEPARRALVAQLQATAEDAAPDDRVWTTPKGLPLASTRWGSYRQRIQKHLAEKIEAARAEGRTPPAAIPKWTTYDLRKFGAWQVYQRCNNLLITARYTGHTDPATLLKHYLAAWPGSAEDLAEAIDWTPEILPLRAVSG